MGRYDGAYEGFFFLLDMSMDDFEISAGDFVGKAEERLILCLDS